MRDTIYRDDAIRVASGYCHPANIAKEIAKLPSAEPERPTGHWIYHPEWEEDGGCPYECDQCGRTYDYKMNFCGYCGRKMEVEDWTT